MLNRDVPREYVLSSNETHSVKEFLDLSCSYLGWKTKWKIDEENPLNTKLDLITEKGIITIMTISEKYYRPAEVDLLWGDCIETMKEIGWKPKNTFHDLIKKMIDWDLKLVE